MIWKGNNTSSITFCYFCSLSPLSRMPYTGAIVLKSDCTLGSPRELLTETNARTLCPEPTIQLSLGETWTLVLFSNPSNDSNVLPEWDPLLLTKLNYVNSPNSLFLFCLSARDALDHHFNLANLCSSLSPQLKLAWRWEGRESWSNSGTPLIISVSFSLQFLFCEQLAFYQSYIKCCTNTTSSQPPVTRLLPLSLSYLVIPKPLVQVLQPKHSFLSLGDTEVLLPVGIHGTLHFGSCLITLVIMLYSNSSSACFRVTGWDRILRWLQQ